MVLERMLAGVSTRRYGRTREPVGAEVGAGRAPTSKSAVSREFVARTRETLADAVMTVDERVVQRVEAFRVGVLAPIAPRSLALVR